jgi:predicted ATPase/class 3 adenylate cyclase
MAELPSGTVTFLLTDVEGSTALWEEAPGAMRVALARHDALFEHAVIEHHGVHIRPRGEGDSRFAVFVSARRAVAAALAIQLSFAGGPWPTPRPIKVRIGIHTGEAELRDGDYYGSAVNRCARLRGIGHGGQTLLSEATASLVREGVPGGTLLRDLGTYRLKDLSQPERVFQLTVPDLPAEFPRLTSLDLHRHNLPTQLTSLVGREREIDALRRLLTRDGVRLVTLTGPGGTGKTRLALQTAAELVGQFDDGVFFVGLAAVTDPAFTVFAIAQTLGVRDLGNRPVLDILMEYLREQRLLLLLDNFEQILPAAPAIAELLAACPGLKVLVTSRTVLRLRGEHDVSVPPLALPDVGHRPLREAVAASPAVALFAQRATEVRPDFRLTDENAVAVTEICRRLDGLPLALELAAARVKLLTPQAMSARLGQRLRLLTGGARDLPARQRTLRDTLAWSYDLLNAAEQWLFRRLAVFVGTWTLEAVEAIAREEGSPLGPTGGDGSIDVLDGIASLVDKSLVRRVSGPDGDVRFTMLETVRELAVELLEASGEADAVRRRHATYFLELAEDARPRLRGPSAPTYLERFEAEHDNLRAAMDWGEAVSDRPGEGGTGIELATRIAKACTWFWMVRSYLLQGRARVDRLIERAPPGSRAHARALLVASGMDRHMGELTRAARLAEEAMAAWRALGDPREVAVALARLAEAEGRLGASDRAQALLAESQALTVDPLLLADLERPLIIITAEVAAVAGDLPAATAAYEQGLALGRADGDLHTTFNALRGLGLLARQRGDGELARRLHLEAVELAAALGDYPCTANSLAGLAFVAADTEHAGRAARLLAAVVRLRELSGMPPVSSDGRRTFDESVAAIYAALGDEAFAAAWAEGRAMTLEQAVAYALDEQPSA